MNRSINRIAEFFGHAARRERLQSPEIVQKTKAVRHPGGRKIFEVQDVGTDNGDGWYNCYEQILDADYIGDQTGEDKFRDKNTRTIEVLNFLESDPVSDYTPALSKYDLLIAWLMLDDAGNSRWMGVPLQPCVREVVATENAPSDQNDILCNVVLRNGVEAQSGELGYHIKVYGQLNNNDWDTLIPLIAQDEHYNAVNRNGKWCFDDTFTPSFICSQCAT